MWLEFLLTSFVVVISPGTGVIYTIGIGISRGVGASIAAAAGCTLGIVPHMTAAIFGLAALLHTSSVAFQVLKFAGVAYLLYMAWSTLRERGALEVASNHDTKPLGRVALTGGLINILNPKLSIFFLAFLPQFIPSSADNAFLSMLMLGAVFMLMTFAVFLIYGFLSGLFRDVIVHSKTASTVMQRVFATSFAGLGLKLAVSDRL